jgi:hypothetical protein
MDKNRKSLDELASLISFDSGDNLFTKSQLLPLTNVKLGFRRSLKNKNNGGTHLKPA